MKKALFALVVALVIAAGALPAAAAAPVTASGAPEMVPGEVLVRFDPGVTAHARAAVRAQHGLEKADDLPVPGLELLRITNGDQPLAKAAALARQPGVRYAEPNYIVRPATAPDDPGFDELWGLHNTGQTGGTADADIDAPEAWDVAADTSGIVVGVIDTGIDISHPDLAANVWTNPGEIPGNGKDDDGNGYVDDVNGWDFFHDDASVYDPGDGDAHGTHVAGTIAAVAGNSVGVTGVSQAQLMAVKFLGPDGGSTAGAVRAIDYAIDNGAHVTNNSWGGGGHSQSLADAIARADAAGQLFVAAAGNGGSDEVGDDLDATPSYPASYPHANVIAVAATTHDDDRSGFSNYGAESVDIGAPGEGILSTTPGSSYGSGSGTSMASPHVAGAVAHLIARNPTMSHSDIRARLLAAADPVDSLAGITVTGGRLNLAVALGHRALPSLSIADTTTVEGNAGATATVDLAVTLSDVSADDVTVGWTTVAGTATSGSDYTSAAGTATIAAGSTSTTVAVDVLGDDADEADETFTVELSGPVGATISRATATITITDNDETIVQPDPGTGGGGGGSGGGGGGSVSGPAPEPETGTTVEAGGSASTDPAGTTASISNPTVLTVTTPVAGTIDLVEHPSAPSVAGHLMVPASIDVTAPVASASDPLVFDIQVAIAALPSSAPITALQVFRNGVAVPGCADPSANVASPDPCVAPSTAASGAVSLRVFTSQASTWSFGVPAVARVAGPDRLATAIATSRAGFGDQAAPAAVLARSDDFPDALAGANLAVRTGGPLLLTPPDRLASAVADELRRVLSSGGTVHLLGGTAALSPAVADGVAALGHPVERHAGADRYATAVAIADATTSAPQAILLTTGRDFPDALAASAAAAKVGGVVVLTDGTSLPAATRAYLDAHPTTTRYAVGGPAAAAAPMAEALVGADRYATAVAVADRFFPGAPVVGIATGKAFPDALGAGARMGLLGAPLLLTATGELPAVVEPAISAADRAEVFGGPVAVSTGVLSQISTLLT